MVTAVRFSNGQEALSIDYSGAKYTRFPPKIAAAQKALFHVVENGKFLKRLRNGHLEKSAVTGLFTPHVHLRLRKCRSRCTLDCGFKTSESPALRGFEAERGPIRGTSLYLVLKSNGLRHSKNLPVKFGFSSKTVPANIAKKLPSQRCSQPLFNFAHKWPTSAFTGESGYTLGFAQRIARSGSHGETRGVSDGALSLPSERSTRFGSPAWPGFKTANFAAFGSWSETLLKNAESLRDSDALMRVAAPKASRPRWAA